MQLDKYTELRIAALVLKTSVSDMAIEIGTTPANVRNACYGINKNPEILAHIDSQINRAETIWTEHLKNRKN